MGGTKWFWGGGNKPHRWGSGGGNNHCFPPQKRDFSFLGGEYFGNFLALGGGQYFILFPTFLLFYQIVPKITSLWNETAKKFAYGALSLKVVPFQIKTPFCFRFQFNSQRIATRWQTDKQFVCVHSHRFSSCRRMFSPVLQVFVVGKIQCNVLLLQWYACKMMQCLHAW